jgi:serine/threonine-protein kinase
MTTPSPDTPSHIGSYPIEKELGRGGMGVVYLARDPRLNRPVAIKVLPAAFVADPSRLQRFEREARTLAALNHRNVAMIFGLEDAQGQRLLVLEFVPGQTLTQKLSRGGLALDETLRLSIQMCEGLEAAHEQGVVHRDLKPDNVKVTPDGTVKILDFGLATTRRADEDATASGSALTVAGMVMGTPGYMSPEQARGLNTDKRTDIWALGCVLFELLSGYKAFSGETVSDCIAAILDREPDYALIPARTPVRLIELLQRCFVKDPRRRLRDIGDARIELEDVLTRPQSGAWAAAPGQTARAGALARLVLPLGPEPTTMAGGVGHGADAPEWALANAACRGLSVSPDGSAVVFVGKSPRQLWLRRLDATESRPIPGTLGADGPVLSDDGVRLAFFADGRLKRLSLTGGAPVPLAPAPRPQGAAWDHAADAIFFVPDFGKPLMRVGATGGTPEPVATPDKDAGELNFSSPETLPGGRAVLVTVHSAAGPEASTIVAIDLRSGLRKPLLENAGTPRYLPSGHLLFNRSSHLLVVGFDAERLEVVGQPSSLDDKVLGNSQTGASHFAAGEEGIIVTAPGAMTCETIALLMAGRGVEAGGRELSIDARSACAPACSPDGRWLCVQALGASDHLSLYDLQRPGSPGVRLTFQGDASAPVFLPDSQTIVYACAGEIRVCSAQLAAPGAAGAERVVASDFSPVPAGAYLDVDKTVIVYTQARASGTGQEVWCVTLGDPASARPLAQGPGNCWHPSVSPDGRWLALVGDESGRAEVYIQPVAGAAAGGSGRRQVSTDGGHSPLWSRSGGELYFRADKTPGDAPGAAPGGPGIVAVRIAVEPAFMVGRARAMVHGAIAPATARTRQYDVLADGLFVIARQREDALRVTRLNVVLNAQGELRKKAPPPASAANPQRTIGGSPAGVSQMGSGLRTVSHRVSAVGPHAVTSMPTVETPTPRQGVPSRPPAPPNPPAHPPAQSKPVRSGEDPYESRTIG